MSRPEPPRRLNLIAWLLAVALWDGLLPVGIVLLPALVHLAIPNHREPIEIIAIVVPMVAFFVRIVVGSQRIRSNHCARWFQVLQFALFFLAALILVLLDAVVILSHVMPAGAFAPSDYTIFAIMFAIYYFLMLLAMYPGREPVPEDDYSLTSHLAKSNDETRAGSTHDSYARNRYS